jgi:hypothetical protein
MTTVVAALLAGVAFWDVLPPEAWTETQLRQMFVASPWGQIARARNSKDVPIYLATAAPMRAAEVELRRRTKPAEDVLYDEYRAWLDENAATHVVVAVRLPEPEALHDAAEARSVEKDARLIVRGKKYPVRIMFSPTRTDPWLRLAFARPQGEPGEAIDVDLYVPGSGEAYRRAVFEVKNLAWKGKLEW